MRYSIYKNKILETLKKSQLKSTLVHGFSDKQYRCVDDNMPKTPRIALHGRIILLKRKSIATLGDSVNEGALWRLKLFA
jgi:hypothetical protein